MLVSILTLTEDVLNTECPPDLRADKGNHANLFHNPLQSVHLSVEKYGLFAENVQSLLHLFIDSGHPVLNVALWFDRVFELVDFAFVGSHVSDCFVARAESKLFAVVIKFQQVRLDSLGVTGTQDLQKIVIWDEVKTR
jgi:hypothetical protein